MSNEYYSILLLTLRVSKMYMKEYTSIWLEDMFKLGSMRVKTVLMGLNY